MKQYILFVVLFWVSNHVFSQIGGEHAYDFLTLPVSARANAMGGIHHHIKDGDPGLSMANPAQLTPNMHKSMSISYTPFFAGTHQANFNYVHDFDFATVQFGTLFMNYGQLQEYDEFGQKRGLFQASDIAIFAGAGHTFKEKYSFGANTKLLYSQIESYSSLGMAFDLAAMYEDTSKLFVASLVVRNVGFQMKAYRKGNQELLPVDVQIGFSKRFKHLPFLLNVTAHNFYRWDILYDDPNRTQSSTDLFGNEEQEQKAAGKFFDNMMRHIILGGELYLGKAFTVQFAYNHHRRGELALDTRGGFSGFSFGFGIDVKRFDIQYSYGKYALPSGSNQLTLNVSLGQQTKTKSSNTLSEE